MLTILLAIVDAFSGIGFGILYFFMLYVDLYIIDNILLPLVRKGREE